MATASGSNPTVRRLGLAARLRKLRLEADKSVEEAAAALMCSPAKISRMETGGRGVQPRDIRDLSRLYGVSKQVEAELQQAATDAKRRGWWQDFGATDEQTQLFLGLESAARTVHYLDALRISGLFQTPAFSRALVSDLRMPVEMTQGRIDEILAARAHRQERLDDERFAVHAIMDEASTRRIIGDTEVMADQVARIIREAERPNVHIRLVPYGRGSYPGLDGSFEHLTFDETYMDDIVYVEGLLGSFVLDKRSETDRYKEIFDYTAKHFALTEAESVAWLQRRHQELLDV